ncbi:MAG: membrane protein insertase YidC [Deltaproteobacteria bacterium]|nr:membrane protein insertase YidC [Deltaproteobacteria bacterium]
MNTNARLIIALLITVIMIVVYQYLFAPKPQQETPTSKETVVTEQEERVEPKAESPQIPIERQQPKEGVVYQDVVVDTPLYTATFSTYGGRLKTLKLKEYMDKVSMHPLGQFVQNTVGGILGKKGVDETPPQPVDIVNTTALEDLPLGIKFTKGEIEYDEGIPFVPSSAGVTLSRNGEKKNLTLCWTSPEGVQIDKQFTFYADSYQMDMEVVVSNPSSRASVKDTLELGWTSEVPEEKTQYRGFFGPIYYADGDYQTIKKPEKIKSESKIIKAVDWFGINQNYFIALIYPSQQGTDLMLSTDSEDIIHSTQLSPLELKPGDNEKISYTLFLGPKIASLLSQITPTAEETANYGFLHIIAVAIVWFLNFTNTFTGNYGLDIIILAVILKILFTPLTHKSQQSMKEMQKLQPEVKKLQEKYKEDKQALNREIMELYKRRKVNPLGGCLPLLLQMPVFFALYGAFLNAIELRHSPFILWIRDLADKDPTYITPLLMGATMFFQQKMTTVSADPSQAKMMAFMPLIFIFIFLNFPSGLVLYWLVTNVLAIVHQLYINKKR